MSSYFTDAEEFTRRARLDEHRRDHHHGQFRPPRTRTRVAATLRRVADRLEQ
jgi:hypothetical protein